ncbi:MAG: hypothetical protein IS860_10410 [Nitrosopumilus sp.]|nr:hypothetical protein [Nitrosopumilus sp.]MCE2506948.1 hypothetical protein [Nitrosopumilaceae archaeon]
MSFDEISAMFDSEYQKLENFIDTATKSDLSIHDIVETYYQIMNVSSMSAMLKQQLDSEKHKELLEKISATDALISEKFNSIVHPQIMEKLAKSIQDTTDNLQSANNEQKSQQDIENEAKLYDELREKMSTKEFVEQYDKGLK